MTFFLEGVRAKKKIKKRNGMKKFGSLGFLPNASSVWLCWAVRPGRIAGSGTEMSTEWPCPLVTLTVNELKLK